jgi:hypothetical protein
VGIGREGFEAEFAANIRIFRPAKGRDHLHHEGGLSKEIERVGSGR